MSPITEYMMQSGLTLTGIVLLGWLLVYASRRWERTAPKGPMELLATLRLEGRRALYLVRIAERTVVLGASEGGMVTILELDPAELPPASLPRRQGLFDDLLTAKRNQHNPPTEVRSTNPASQRQPSEPTTRA